MMAKETLIEKQVREKTNKSVINHVSMRMRDFTYGDPVMMRGEATQIFNETFDVDLEFATTEMIELFWLHFKINLYTKGHISIVQLTEWKIKF